MDSDGFFFFYKILIFFVLHSCEENANPSYENDPSPKKP